MTELTRNTETVIRQPSAVLDSTTRKMLIVPRNSGVVEVLKRAVRRRRIKYNYLVTWHDVQGVGISLAIVDWLAGNDTYIN